MATPSTRVHLGDMHALYRAGLATYEEVPEHRSLFGVVTWRIELTDLGRAAVVELKKGAP